MMLHDRVVLVTGAGAGIGRAVAVLAADRGARAVVVVDRDDRSALETADLIEAAGAQPQVVSCDLSDRTAPDRMVAAAVAEFGVLDCAVNNAAISKPAVDIAECDDELWESVIDTNLSGVFRCVRAEIRAMAAGGSIVNVASAAVARVTRGLAPYTVSKSGVVALTRVAAAETGAVGIRVNAVCPGRTETPMMLDYLDANQLTPADLATEIPLGRLARPTDVAEAIVWLLSEHAAFVHGEILVVDGGRTI